MPSSDVSTTSVASPRMVRVTGATMISASCSMTVSRVRSRTGRRLSGGRNVYQRISPRFIPELVPAISVPPEEVLGIRELTRRNRGTRVTLGVVRSPDHDHLHDLSFGSGNARHSDDSVVNLSGCAVRLHPLKVGSTGGARKADLSAASLQRSSAGLVQRFPGSLQRLAAGLSRYALERRRAEFVPARKDDQA